MSGDVFEYIVIWLFAVMAVFSFLIWSEKMVKILIWNYIIWLWLLCISMLFNVLVYYFDQHNWWAFMGISFESYKKFITNWHITIILILYIWALVLLFTKSFIEVRFPADDLKRNLIFVALIPWTIFSLIFTLEIVLFGTKLFNIQTLVELAKEISNNNVMYNFVFLTPLWFFIHAVWTLLITTELEVQYNPNVSSTSFDGNWALEE